MSELTPLDRFRWMARIRAFERACLEGVPTGEIHGELHTGIGQEAIAAGMAGWLRDDDALVSTHRNHAHALIKGVDPRALLAEIFERRTGLCGGFGGHMHPFRPPSGSPPAASSARRCRSRSGMPTRQHWGTRTPSRSRSPATAARTTARSTSA